MNLFLRILELMALYYKAMDEFMEINSYFTNTMELHRRKRNLHVNALVLLRTQLYFCTLQQILTTTMQSLNVNKHMFFFDTCFGPAM